VEYEETYHGQRIIVTTLRQATGDWTAKAELLRSGGKVAVEGCSDDRYPSEEQARSAALSLAAGVVDRTRVSRGKP